MSAGRIAVLVAGSIATLLAKHDIEYARWEY
jgi:hypothetical protein